MLAIYRLKGSAHPQDAVEMTQLTPTARLEWLLTQDSCSEAHETIRELLQQYERFLDATNRSETDLIARFLDSRTRKEYSESENKIGDLMFIALERVGQRSPFHRVLVV